MASLAAAAVTKVSEQLL